MIAWLYWLENDFIAFSLCIIALASGIWEWIAWRRLKREPIASQMRRCSEVTSVSAGTGSILWLAIPLLITNTIPGLKLPGGELAFNVWIYVGAGVSGLTLLASSLSRRRLRIPGIISGVTMLVLWWDTWVAIQVVEAYSNL